MSFGLYSKGQFSLKLINNYPNFLALYYHHIGKGLKDFSIDLHLLPTLYSVGHKYPPRRV